MPFLTISEMVKNYVEAIKNIQAEGPYFIIGFSAGGIVAHELACVLEEMSNEIAYVVIIDSLPHEADAQCNIKNEIDRSYSEYDALINALKFYNISISDYDSYNNLLNKLLNYLKEKKMIPDETPVYIGQKIASEMLFANHRILKHKIRKGKFRVLFFAAAPVGISINTKNNGVLWSKYCSEVECFSVNASHMDILNNEGSEVIAEVVNRVLSSK
jgi:thioesterase domain-containing protein